MQFVHSQKLKDQKTAYKNRTDNRRPTPEHTRTRVSLKIILNHNVFRRLSLRRYQTVLGTHLLRTTIMLVYYNTIAITKTQIFINV